MWAILVAHTESERGPLAVTSIGASIRESRTARGWSQARLADALNEVAGHATLDRHYVARWERNARKPGYYWLPHIERVLSVDLHGTAPDPAGSSSEDDDMRRRTLLGLVDGSVLDSAAKGLEPVRRQLDAALDGPVTEDDATEWERAVDRYSRLVNRFPAEQVLPGLLIGLDEVRGQLETASGDLWLRLLGVCALLSGLAATSLVGAGCWSDAERYWRTAQRAARFSEDRVVRCLVASDRAVFGIYMPGGNPATLLGIADEALAWGEGTISKGTANALSARAQVLSLLGDRAGAYAALATLETVFEQLDGGWPEPRLCHVRSFVYSHVGSARESAAAQDQALAKYPCPLSPGAVQVQMHRARSIIASGDPTQGVRHIVTMLEKIGPSFRHGYVGTSAEFALHALPEKARSLSGVQRARELISEKVAL
ncbi:MAG: helix-turn-helix transcriptional regulator [Pseudonocardia sp.]|nr:helix-turn-helix transcriptional regulator [Pseudonocardia sp.]